MPWCPSCRNEYDPIVAACADCGVALVADRPAEARDGPDFLLLVFPSGEHRERAIAALEVAAVPFARDEGPEGKPLLAIPAALGSTAIDRLDRAYPDLVLEPGEGFFLVRPFDPSRDREIRDHPILRSPWPALAEPREEALAALRECLVRGSRTVRERARFLLRRFGPAALPCLAVAMRDALEAEDDVVAAEVLAEIAGAGGNPGWPEEVRALGDLVAAAEPKARRWGILLAGRLRLREAGAGLIALLGDSDPGTALAADEALSEITGEDLRFEPGLPPADLERVREARRRSLSGS